MFLQVSAINSVEQVHKVIIVNKSSITEKPTWVTYSQREITNTNDDMEFEETISTEPMKTTSKAMEYLKETLTKDPNSMESMKTYFKKPENTTELDIDKVILSTALTKSDEEVEEENSTIFSGITLDFETTSVKSEDFETTSVKSENTSESLIQEESQAGEFGVPSASSQSQIDHSFPGNEDNVVERKIEMLTTTDKEYLDQSTVFVTDENVTRVKQYFTHTKQDSADSDNNENMFINEIENDFFSIGSEIITEYMFYPEIASPSTKSENGVITFSPNNSKQRKDVLFPSDVDKINLSSKPEYTTDFEMETMSLTSIEEDYSNQSTDFVTEGYEFETSIEDYSEDSGNISEFEIEPNAQSEPLSSLGKILETEDKKSDEIIKQVPNTSQFVNGQVEEQEKYLGINNKTIIFYVNSTFLPVSISNLSDIQDEEIFENIPSIEINQIDDDDILWNTTETGENFIKEHFINGEEVYDCLENITCISEFYDDAINDAHISLKDQIGVGFNETDIIDEEPKNEYTFDVENMNKEYDDELRMSGINNETDHLDINKETNSESYSGLSLYDEEAVGENKAHLAESAQIISRKVA